MARMYPQSRNSESSVDEGHRHHRRRARHRSPYRIRVNAISPGWIEVGDWKKSSKSVIPHHSKIDRQQHAVGRVGVPADIAKACQFLAENADFMTGQNITLDGGMTVKMVYAE